MSDLLTVEKEINKKTFSLLIFMLLEDNSSYDLRYSINSMFDGEEEKGFKINCSKKRLIEILTIFKYYDDNFIIDDDSAIDYSVNIEQYDDIEVKALRIGIYNTIEVIRKFNLNI